MNLVRFIENRYQEVRYEYDVEEIKGNYLPWKDAEIKALHNVLTIYRAFMRLLLTPKIFFDFFLMKVSLRPEPIPILVNKIREKKDREDREKFEKESIAEAVKNMQPGEATVQLQ